MTHPLRVQTMISHAQQPGARELRQRSQCGQPLRCSANHAPAIVAIRQPQQQPVKCSGSRDHDQIMVRVAAVGSVVGCSLRGTQPHRRIQARSASPVGVLDLVPVAARASDPSR